MNAPEPPAGPLTISIIYDNNGFDPRLKTAWGFSALVEYRGRTLLFDTGGSGPVLLDNMRLMGIDPASIETVMISHHHGDHADGLLPLLQSGIQPTVYLPGSFPGASRQKIAGYTKVLEAAPGSSLSGEFYSTGTLGEDIPEQSLVVRTEDGLVVITGCAHPGVVEIVSRAIDQHQQPVRLVLGGFHLGKMTGPEIQRVVEDLRRMGVEKIAPCHCTGDLALSIFTAEYGNDFIQTGTGKVIVLDGEH